MRLIRVVVADAGHDVDLALAVQLGKRAERGMPVQARILGERRPRRGRQRQAWTQSVVGGIVRRVQDRQRVRTAVEEDGYEHLAVRIRGRSGRDPLLVRLRAQRRAPVDGQSETEAAGQEGATVEAGPGRRRHAGLDRGQAAARLRDAPAQQLCARMLVAAGHQTINTCGGRGTRQAADGRRSSREADMPPPSSRWRP